MTCRSDFRMDPDHIAINLYDHKEKPGEIIKLVQFYSETVSKDYQKYSVEELNFLRELLRAHLDAAIQAEKDRRERTINLFKAMQHSNKEYDPTRHERKKALTVKLPYADYIAKGKKTIEVRSQNTKHRGELIICSSQSPEIEGMTAGAMLARVELYDTKPLEELTREEWEMTCIPEEDRKGLTGYGWFLKDPVRLIEYPVTGQLGIWNLVRDSLEFLPYDVEQQLRDELKKKTKAIPEFDRKAVWIGGILITAIFVTAAAIIYGAVWLIIDGLT